MHLFSALEQSLFGVDGISGLNEMMAGVGDPMCCQGLPLNTLPPGCCQCEVSEKTSHSIDYKT